MQTLDERRLALRQKERTELVALLLHLAWLLGEIAREAIGCVDLTLPLFRGVLSAAGCARCHASVRESRELDNPALMCALAFWITSVTRPENYTTLFACRRCFQEMAMRCIHCGFTAVIGAESCYFMRCQHGECDVAVCLDCLEDARYDYRRVRPGYELRFFCCERHW